MNTRNITASDLKLDLANLYSFYTEVGNTITTTISVLPSIPITILPIDFYSHLTIEIKGQKTHNTDFTFCTPYETTHGTEPHSTFSICISTLVADFYDLYLYYDGQLLPDTPAYAGLQFDLSKIHVNYTQIKDLPSTVPAGEGRTFSLALFDMYNNTIPYVSGYSIHFTNNANGYIQPVNGPDSNLYYFELFFNHTTLFSFQVLVNNYVYNTVPFEIQVIASDPCYLSTVQYLDDATFSVLSSIQVLLCWFIHCRFKLN